MNFDVRNPDTNPLHEAPAVLIGCEFSGAVRRAFRQAGLNAWSCDLLPAADGSLFHIQGDVLDVLDGLGARHLSPALHVFVFQRLTLAQAPARKAAADGDRH